MYPVIPALALFPFYSYTISMLSFRTGLPQYRLSLLKAQIPAYLQKVVDTHSFVGIITQQLSNSATQQLSNSATQQLRRKVCLRSEKRAAFSSRQQYHYFFSSIFADGTSGVSVFTFTHRRCFTALGIFCALGMQKRLHYNHIINTAFYRRSRPTVWFDSG